MDLTWSSNQQMGSKNCYITKQKSTVLTLTFCQNPAGARKQPGISKEGARHAKIPQRLLHTSLPNALLDEGGVCWPKLAILHKQIWKWETQIFFWYFSSLLALSGQSDRVVPFAFIVLCWVPASKCRERRMQVENSRRYSTLPHFQAWLVPRFSWTSYIHCENMCPSDSLQNGGTSSLGINLSLLSSKSFLSVPFNYSSWTKDFCYWQAWCDFICCF